MNARQPRRSDGAALTAYEFTMLAVAGAMFAGLITRELLLAGAMFAILVIASFYAQVFGPPDA